MHILRKRACCEISGPPVKGVMDRAERQQSSHGTFRQSRLTHRSLRSNTATTVEAQDSSNLRPRKCERSFVQNSAPPNVAIGSHSAAFSAQVVTHGKWKRMYMAVMRRRAASTPCAPLRYSTAAQHRHCMSWTDLTAKRHAYRFGGPQLPRSSKHLPHMPCTPSLSNSHHGCKMQALLLPSLRSDLPHTPHA